MPSGKFVRTPEYRAKISRTLKGRNPLNTRGVYDVLIAEINKIIVGSDAKLTWMGVYKALKTQGIMSGYIKGFKNLCPYFYRACKLGEIDRNQIYDGRIHNGKNWEHGVRSKFHVGDKVRITGKAHQTPLWLREEIRLDNCRTIKAIRPREGPREHGKHIDYYLGSNGIGKSYAENHAFRSEELELYSKKTTVGRPSTKRKYTRHYKDTSPVESELLVNRSESPSISCVNRELAEVTA